MFTFVFVLYLDIRRAIFPIHVGEAKIAMSDRLAEGVDAIDLNNTKLPFLLKANKLRVCIVATASASNFGSVRSSVDISVDFVLLNISDICLLPVIRRPGSIRHLSC